MLATIIHLQEEQSGVFSYDFGPFITLIPTLTMLWYINFSGFDSVYIKELYDLNIKNFFENLYM